MTTTPQTSSAPLGKVDVEKEKLLDSVARIALALQSVDPKLHEDFRFILKNRRTIEAKLEAWERECGKWKTQAEIAKEQSTAWMAENEVLKQKLRIATDFCQVCGKHPPCEHVPNNSLSSLPTS